MTIRSTDTPLRSADTPLRPAGAPLRDAPRVAIVGAGVSGLGIGWRLARAGCRVEVLDKGRAGRGASWAAAGMLAAGVEAEPGEEALYRLNLEARRLWPSFRDELQAASGADIGYRGEGTIVAAPTRDDLERLRHVAEFQAGIGVELEWLTAAEARRREPYFRAGMAGAVFSRHDHQVDNRALAGALRTAFLAAGGRLFEDTPVDGLDIAAGRAAGVVVRGARRPADIVVNAAGAWANRLAGAPERAVPPVRPVKGQMAALRMDPARPVATHVVWGPNTYIVPRANGRLLIGATVEERGFDAELTAGGVMAVIEAAWRVLPAIEELPIDELWTGFRPTSRDDAPILGESGVDGLLLATGHHRNGILLAPVTADAIARLALTGRTDPVVAGFGIGRFRRPEGVPAAEAGERLAGAAE